MAHIIEFSIDGLAGRKSTYSKVLNRDVNVFFGLNGSGKTSLLKILHSAMSSDVSILKNVSFTEARVVIYSQEYNRNYEYTIKKKKSSTSDGETKISSAARAAYKKLAIDNTVLSSKIGTNYQGLLDLWSEQPKWESSPKTKDDQKWRHGYLPISRLYVGATSKANSSSDISEDTLDERFSEILQNVWLRYSFDINSKVRKAQEEGLANILQEILNPTPKRKKQKDDITPELAFEKVSRFLSRQRKVTNLDSSSFIKRFSENSDIRNIVNDIDRVENSIDEAMYPIDKLNSLVNQLVGSNKKIKFGGREIEIAVGDGSIISPQLLSSGEKHLLKLLIEIVSVGESTLIIDEPELSMHIDWQKNLLQNMTLLNPNAQLIVATHSPEVMSKIDDSKIFRL